MGSRVKGITLCLTILLLVFFNAGTIFGASVKLESTIKFSPKGEALQDPWAFCVTEDDIFLILDHNAGNIKVYELNGTLLSKPDVIGSKGIKKGELVNPSLCFYSENESIFGVLDDGRRTILVYERNMWDRKEFSLFREIPCPRLAYDLKLVKGKLLISGFTKDQNEKPYHLYYIDLLSIEDDTTNLIPYTTFLLPSYYKFGLKSFDEYKSEFRGKPDLKAIGLDGFFDAQGDNIYFAWSGNLKIIRLDISTKDISYFGRPTSHYKKPTASEKLIDAYLTRDVSKIKKEKKKLFYVRQVFTTPDCCMVVYEGPNPNQNNGSLFRLQIYSLKGKLLNDIPIPGQSSSKMWFDKDKSILYSLIDKERQDGDIEHFILKYKIYK